MEDMFELMEAVDNLLISNAMGWDMDGAIERLRVAKARVDVLNSEVEDALSDNSPVTPNDQPDIDTFNAAIAAAQQKTR
jgi:hypothetical protein